MYEHLLSCSVEVMMKVPNLTFAIIILEQVQINMIKHQLITIISGVLVLNQVVPCKKQKMLGSVISTLKDL